MRRLLLLLLALCLVLAACGGSSDDSSSDDSDNQIGLFDWERDPDTMIVRLDRHFDSPDDPTLELNNIPPCTVWGDGRVVWVTRGESGEEVVLKARIDESAIRSFLEDIINRGFYEWDKELVTLGTEDPVIESITVSLYDEPRTVERYSYWPQNAYAAILEECQQLGSENARVVEPGAPGAPETGGWISAYQVNDPDPNAPSNNWEWRDAPFTLYELVENREGRWVEGDLARQVWLSAREDRGDVLIMEYHREGDTEVEYAYRLAILVPGISRDALPPPDDSTASDTAPSE
ncbi:MAG: hypothetical protein GYB65_08350 [Chloroflexi bacterium]|nr:hypothetical protein [Chloroflexota bacterium]